METDSSRQRRKPTKGCIAMLATLLPIAAYADLGNPWSHSGQIGLEKPYVVNEPKSAPPLWSRARSKHSTTELSPAVVRRPHSRERHASSPNLEQRLRGIDRIPMTLALLLAAQAQKQQDRTR